MRISDEILDSILVAGSWSTNAVEDLKLREQLPMELVLKLVRGSKYELGLLALTTGAGKWGVVAASPLPEDPANDRWLGPRASAGHGDVGAGKHLMSYSVGGVGLPHADRAYLADFIAYILSNHPNIGGGAERSQMKAIETKLRTGGTFDQVRSGQVFLEWIKLSLQQRDGQRWLLEEWLNRYWLPSLSEVTSVNGTVEEALINARIRNSSPDLARCAIKQASGAKDRVQAELVAYASPNLCHGAKERFKTDRWGWMKRSAALYNFVSHAP
jgi:hypothetical protein